MEGGGQATGKVNRALRYELSDEGDGEVLAVYDEGENGKRDFLERGRLVVSSGLGIGEGEAAGEERVWVVMGAVGICEKARRRAGSSGRISGGLGGSTGRVL